MLRTRSNQSQTLHSIKPIKMGTIYILKSFRIRCHQCRLEILARLVSLKDFRKKKIVGRKNS
ncbi:Uncharacterized protein APZ42_021475 [Daphnia magna]|uniref:Uncharacterized protein n=1 Tax=Daphnia magna TaxID=35525 RepID=A0A164WMK5_9CRUS|nr:Uncharacterized protein APZ42_021475 [Daphnia magna]